MKSIAKEEESVTGYFALLLFHILRAELTSTEQEKICHGRLSREALICGLSELCYIGNGNLFEFEQGIQRHIAELRNL